MNTTDELKTLDASRDTPGAPLDNLLQEFQNISGAPYELSTLVSLIRDPQTIVKMIILSNKADEGKNYHYRLKEEQGGIQILEVPTHQNGSGDEKHKLVASVANLTFEDIRSHYQQTAPIK